MKRLVSVVAARPNFVKLAAIHYSLQGFPGVFEHIVIHTGQHYDPLFSDIFFEELKLPTPTFNLGVHGDDRGMVLEATKGHLFSLLPDLRPDSVLVYGDVNGAYGAAQAASKAGIPLAHVEAGLRSFDPEMPEEHNRIGIDGLSSLLFCTEQSGIENLRREGVKGTAHLVGNTMIDTLVRMMPLIERESPPVSLPEPYAICTLHRPSNVDTKETLQRNLTFLGEVAERIPLVLPVHHRLRSRLDTMGLRGEVHSKIILTEPLGYIPFLRLLLQASFIITDSGGLQEEATFLKKRCFTLRRSTERPSTIESGSNTLVQLEHEEDRTSVLAYAAHPVPPSVTIPPLWDGKAGERILGVLAKA